MIELMVVMAMMATIIAIAMPRYFDGLTRTKETALRQNLKEMREAIDYYHQDKGQYPESLEALVTERYLRFIPQDPITEKTDTWQLLPASESPRHIQDVLSGSLEQARDGTYYQTW
jgi:general secretion pathway protein G